MKGRIISIMCVVFVFVSMPAMACTAPALCPNIGDVCDDGNAVNDPDPVFAGFLIYDNATCEALYTGQSDHSAGIEWTTTSNSDDISTDSWHDGKINHANRGGNIADFPAFELCENLTDGGFNDWYLPSLGELNLLCEYENLLGGFTSASYFSSSEHASLTHKVSGTAFSSCYTNIHMDKTTVDRVRCVRRD